LPPGGVWNRGGTIHALSKNYANAYTCNVFTARVDE